MKERDPKVVIDEFAGKLQQDGKLISAYLPPEFKRKYPSVPSPDKTLIHNMRVNLQRRPSGQAISPLRMVAGYIDKHESGVVEVAWFNQVGPRHTILWDAGFSHWYAVSKRLLDVEGLLFGENYIKRALKEGSRRYGLSLSEVEIAEAHLEMSQRLELLKKDHTGFTLMAYLEQDLSSRLTKLQQDIGDIEGIDPQELESDAALVRKIVGIGANRYRKLYTMLTEVD